MHRLLILVLPFVLLGCSDSLDVNQYLDWHRENKIKSSLEANGLRVSLEYRPNELMALNELSKKQIIDLDEEKKAAMVSNLMVILCSDKDAAPVVNAGTLNT